MGNNRSVNATARQAGTLKQSLNLSMEQDPITGGRFRIKNMVEKSIGRTR
jgi:hypothetical protein